MFFCLFFRKVIGEKGRRERMERKMREKREKRERSLTPVTVDANIKGS